MKTPNVGSKESEHGTEPASRPEELTGRNETDAAPACKHEKRIFVDELLSFSVFRCEACGMEWSEVVK